MERTSETELIKGIPPRTWVALSADESRVVGTGPIYGEAVDRAVEQGERELFQPYTSGVLPLDCSWRGPSNDLTWEPRLDVSIAYKGFESNRIRA